MQDRQSLRVKLDRIDGKGYKAYQEIEGCYDFGKYMLFIDKVQADPFAPPSKIRIRVEQRYAKFPFALFETRNKRIALCDYIARCVANAIKKLESGVRGTGKSGLILIDHGKQEILERSSIKINEDYIEARLFCGLPARGRKILGKDAEKIFFSELSQITENSLFFQVIDQNELRSYIELVEDQEYIRANLSKNSLVAFVANGSILPRRSGISDLPLIGKRVIPFKSPQDLEISFNTPNHGIIKGMGIPEGVTLIVGGGYHGKSTLLRAIERGVYNHIPDDGREWVITVKEAVKIRAEDGRRVEKVDISPFIDNLPFGQNTHQFTTENASGSTSQAANIIEALEIGAKLLLIDEDTSATNFMIRDARMQALVTKEKEPITPFIDKVRLLKTDMGVSTILVIGGSGDYLDVADTVIMLDEYVPRNVTEQAKSIIKKYENRREPEGGIRFGKVAPRIPLPESFDPRSGVKTKVSAKGLDTIQFGHYSIELDYVEQLVDVSQTRAIADMIYYAWRRQYFNGKNTLREVIELIEQDLDKYGLDVFSPYKEGSWDYARPRKFEIAAAINRLRSLKIY